MKNKNQVSRADFRSNSRGNRDKSGIIAKIGASNRKMETVEDGFAPSLSADDLNGQTVEGKIVQFEDWQNGKQKGTSIHFVNNGVSFRVPLYTVIERKLARYQDRKDLDRKKAVGLTVRITGLGHGEAKRGQSAPALFEVAVA